MATLYVSEFQALGSSSTSPPQIAALPAIAEQTVAISGASTATASPFSAQTRFIRVNVDQACSIVIGATPVATTANLRMAADQTEYFGVQPGAKIAVIANT